MKNLSRSIFSKTFGSLILIFVLSIFSITYFLDDGFPDQQIEYNPNGATWSFFDFPLKFGVLVSDNYTQYGQFSIQIGKLVVFYDSFAENQTPEFPTTIGNDSGIIEKFLIESHIVISKDNKIIEILNDQIVVNKTNYLEDITKTITWDLPNTITHGYKAEVVENYQIARASKSGFVFENGSESYAIISHPTISFDYYTKNWSYSAGGALWLKIIWKNQNYTSVVVTISSIALLTSIVLIVRNMKKSTELNDLRRKL